jgi:hypothetical protein
MKKSKNKSDSHVELFDFKFPKQTSYLKDTELRKKTTEDQWFKLEYPERINNDGLLSSVNPMDIANYEAEKLFAAFEIASDMDEWKQYLSKYPPSPETLALVMFVAAEEYAKSLSTRGLNKRHKENRDMKAEAFLWLDQNRAKYKSMDDVAIAITELSPIKFRAAREWVAEWKKLRSTSKT